MSIIREARPQSKFYILDKSISEDRRLSWAARGLLVFILGKPDHWEVSVANLVNETKMAGTRRSGREAVYGIIKELEAAGYIRRQRARSEKGGKFSGFDYVVSESPCFISEECADEQHVTPQTGLPTVDMNSAAKLPQTGLPLTVQPDAANTTQVSTDKTTKTDIEQNPLVPSCDDTKAKGYPEEFEKVWSAYPKRLGGNPKRSAFKAWQARLNTMATESMLADGVERYRRFIEATGKVGTQYVMQAATFFGPDERYLEDWTVPAVNHQQTGAGQRSGMAQPQAAGTYSDDNDIPDWLRGIES